MEGRGLAWVMGREGVNGSLEALPVERYSLLVGVEVKLPISRSTGADGKGALENFMVITRGDEFDVIGIMETVCN